MWFGKKKKKDKDVFEYEVYAGVKGIPDGDVRLCRYIDIVEVNLYFRNSFYNISKHVTIFSDTLESFKEGSKNEYMLTMPTEDFEKKFIIPAIKEKMSEIMELNEKSKEIEKIINSFKLKGKVNLKEDNSKCGTEE